MMYMLQPNERELKSPLVMGRIGQGRSAREADQA